MKKTKKDPNVGSNPLEADATSKYRDSFLAFGQEITNAVQKTEEKHPKEVSVFALFMVGDQIASFLHGKNVTLKNMICSCLRQKNQDSVILEKAFKDYVMDSMLNDIVEHVVGDMKKSRKKKAKKDGEEEATS